MVSSTSSGFSSSSLKLEFDFYSLSFEKNSSAAIFYLESVDGVDFEK